MFAFAFGASVGIFVTLYILVPDLKAEIKKWLD